ncbi:MAG: aminopeptidase P family protein [Paracoccaceae bacterium]
MFQSFEVTSNPGDGAGRLRALRGELVAADLDGFLVPRSDAFRGENVAPRDARLAWLTGFSGSAGFCAALGDKAGVFIDGRYRVQVLAQVDGRCFTPVHWPEVKLGDWLREALPDGGKVGFDGWLHTPGEIDELRKSLAGSGVELYATENLVDRIWHDRPDPPLGKAVDHPVKFAGEAARDKRARLAAELREAHQRAAVISLPDSIAWLLNIRGSDIARVPVVQAFALLHDDARVQLFSDPAKFDGLALDSDVTLLGWERFAATLGALRGPVRLDNDSAPLAIRDILDAAKVKVVTATDPCILPKARKNEVEIAGARAAHLRDGAAMVEFLCWLDGAAPGGGLDEIKVVRALEGFRRATDALLDISFETICGAGPNGAIVHYRVDEASNRAIGVGELLLVDSGGQYRDGTTDITRTIAVGPPGAEERAAFSRVLQGMIAISQARWPKGLAGRDLDALARRALWSAGQDYDHGTGHGVGSYLGVHEGPHGISRRATVPLEVGMILSNEPGYYREGAFGIRCENLLVVRDAPVLEGGDARDMLCFETITLVPIDRRLIEADMLSRAERAWIDAYHARVARKIGPRLSAGARDWLVHATAPL